MDKLTPDRRSRNMRQIRGKNTVPELRVRRLCREIGFSGYRIHRKDLPGKPDLAWIGRKLAIFVHGCSGMVTAVLKAFASLRQTLIIGFQKLPGTSNVMLRISPHCVQQAGLSSLFGNVNSVK